MSHAVPNGVDGFQQLLFVELREEHFERMLMAGVIQRDSGFMAVSVFKRYDSMINTQSFR
ncbi:conserved hypothetical protein [Escherichia coli]|jgi:hypothetical protein|uniref:Uncharacterized protein n=1 Tax=Escherichia coli O6:H1 (strain CFT073 / ATCC 700928 / UPEC) TaxID=199310 RepID=A0A0H2VDV5_ECOL6|nr:Hypothetical protein c4531 [Escherichia coli CFT073]EDX39283.1 conserved hypothetical protein [Escherichia coli 101-1]EZJ30363.1 hypothetical protein AD23_5244 [Escherichia coli 2-005-03_S4_C3]KDT28746.1 hypothetical protein AC67_1178 [Escherichia coli 2-052-05_S4_C1]KEL76764.1 hypothetical protein AC52_0402 [Escherichia coli 5-366-08_S3_C3]PRW37397.1 hypothetical protein CSC05_3382 [Escherichia coli]